mmetsp:Transcript_99819/g.172069  ORF Transcript_99819/g.172069 Transcript_99819/m.172069 type:complete len:292 (-) Transcript_99819:179-1054(-)
MRGPSGGGDALVHQDPTKIIDAAVQQHLSHAEPLLRPRHLQIVDGPCEHQPGHCVGQHHLATRRPPTDPQGPPRARVLVDWGLGGHEGQWHKLGEAPGLLLQLSQSVQMGRHVLGALEVPVHDRCGRAEPCPVRLSDHLHPLGRCQPPGGELSAHCVVQNLSGRAREGPHAGVAGQPHKLCNAGPGGPGAVDHLLWGQCMEVQAGDGGPDGGDKLKVTVPRETRSVLVANGQSGLHAHFGGPQVVGLFGPADNLLRGKVVGLLVDAGPGEGAEATALDAGVGEVDVAVDDV